MKQFAVKLEVTNNRNDDKRTEWYFCDTEEEKSNWVSIKKKEQEQWNFNTPGAVSFRDYDFEYYNAIDLLGQPLSNFDGLTLVEFIEIIKSCL